MTKLFKPKDFTVGQTVLISYSGSYRNDPEGTLHPKEVTKVGREFVFVGNKQYRFRPEDMSLRPLSPKYDNHLGRVFLSREEYEKANAADEAWSRFRNTIRSCDIYTRPSHLTAEEIDALSAVIREKLKP